MVKEEYDELDELFVCGNCHKPIAPELAKIRPLKRRLRVAMGALKEAQHYLETIGK